MDRLWRGSRPLTAVGLFMLALTPISLAGLLLDARVITGMPAWMKPAKFAVSTGIFCLTMAWVLSYLPEWRRLRAIAGWVTALVFVMEVAIIDVQAWRGVASHFNVGTNLDGILFLTMGVGIMLQTLMTAVVAGALFLTRFEDPAMGWALRLGLVISIAGASTGILMTRPNDAQIAQARANGGRYIVNGAHSIGGPDGGAGLPGVGWSTEHGDLRVPHFVGIHAIQFLPLLALLASPRLPARRRTGLVVGAAVAYAGIFWLLLTQALGGQPLVRL